jgi:hypothetical protein
MVSNISEEEAIDRSSTVDTFSKTGQTSWSYSFSNLGKAGMRDYSKL